MKTLTFATALALLTELPPGQTPTPSLDLLINFDPSPDMVGL
jgi:hypothetical protein